MITIEGVEIPNLISELTIEQFDRLNNIENDKSLGTLNRWIAKFVYLGIDEEVFDDYTKEMFEAVVARWSEEIPELEKQPTVEIDGYTYEAKPTIGVKDLSLIEQAYKKGLSNFSSETLAILFKRTDLTRTEHYANAHIKKKTALFKKQKAEIAIPYIKDVIDTIVTNAQKVNDSE